MEKKNWSISPEMDSFPNPVLNLKKGDFAYPPPVLDTAKKRCRKKIL